MVLACLTQESNNVELLFILSNLPNSTLKSLPYNKFRLLRFTKNYFQNIFLLIPIFNTLSVLPAIALRIVKSFP